MGFIYVILQFWSFLGEEQLKNTLYEAEQQDLHMESGFKGIRQQNALILRNQRYT